MRVHSNIAYMPNRRLPQVFSTNAIGTAAPNTLNSNLPKIQDAMGVAGRDGVFSIITDTTADITLHFWSNPVNTKDPSKGWVLANEATAGNTKTVAAHSLCTFTVPENCLIFMQASTAVKNCWVMGSKFEGNPNADMAPNAADA
jgi:hypothetical protein